MNFKEAIIKMLEDGEFPKIIKNAKGKDKRDAQDFYDLIKDNKNLKDIPYLPLLMSINSQSILRDAIVYMDKDKDTRN